MNRSGRQMVRSTGRVGGLRGLAQRMVGRMLGLEVASFAELWSTLRGWKIIGDGEAEVTRPMAQAKSVYRCVNVISQTIAGLPLVLRRGGQGDPLMRGPAFELLNNPYPGMTWRDLVEELIGHTLMTGAGFVLDADLIENPRQRVSERRPPRRLYVVGQNRMTPPRWGQSQDDLLWWNYRPRGGGIPLPIVPEFAPYLRLFNPDNEYLGLGPLEAAMLSIKQDYKAATFNVACLDNGGAVGGLYVLPDDGGGAERRQEFMRAIEERHRGAGRANKPGLLWGGADWKQTAYNMVDLQLNEARKLSREDIYEAFGVPPILGDVFEAAHYNVGDSAQEIFLLNTIGPLVAKTMGLFNVLILPAVEPGVTMELDLSDHPVMQRIERSKYDSLAKLLQNGVPYNEAIRELRLPFKDQAWGDTSLLSAGYVTAEDTLAGYGAPPEEEPAEVEEPEEEQEEEEEARLTEAQTAAAAREERRREERLTRAAMPGIRNRYRAFFTRQENQLNRRLSRALRSAAASGIERAAEEGLSEAEARRIASKVLLDIGDEQSRLRRLVSQYWPASARAVIRKELERLGVAEERIGPLTERLLKGRWFKHALRIKAAKIAGIERVTRRRVQAQLIDGLKRGETAEELSTRLHDVLGGNRARALLIARNEAGQAVGTGRYLAATAAGAKAKGWLTGSYPRATHLQAGRQYHPAKGAIAMDETFEVGADRLMYPRDPRGSAGEIINCNCVMVTTQAKKDQAA